MKLVEIVTKNCIHQAFRVITCGDLDLWSQKLVSTTNPNTSMTKQSQCLHYGNVWAVTQLLTVNPRMNAPGVYSYNTSEPLVFIGDPAFITSCCIGLLRKSLCSCLLGMCLSF